MMRLFAVFKNRWVVSGLGLAAVALLIWMAGPLLSFAGYEPLAPEWVRAAVIAVVAAIWVAIRVRRELQAQRQNQQMLQGMAAPAEAPSPTALQTGEELAELQRRFEEAVGLLKKARLGGEGEKQYLHQLPWYVIIGPPGSGKTTALVNSGLHFPLAGGAGGQAKVKGVGGTRNCDWWFTDEAVLLDTAGRYTTQDSQAEVDRAAWLGFLGLLKKYRRRRPINGVLVAVSAADLMQQTETETAAHVRAIRQRLEELHKELGIRFPVYLLFTKCDLIAGFVEFFDDLGQDARAQVWGFTFPAETLESPDQALAAYQAEFQALERRLDARVLERLQAERDPVRRDRVYGFPQQFASLRQATERFATEVLRPSRFETPAMLRGVYFTSGTQEGAPVDRLMGALAQTFGLAREAVARFSGAGRSYFLTRFFRDLVFHEAPLAGTDRAAEHKRLWLQRAAYAGAIGLTLVLGAGWLTSYYRNAAYVEEVSRITAETQKTLDRFAPGERDLLQLLTPLNAARDLPGGYGSRGGGAPFLMGLGLYQGYKLGSQARAAYLGTLRDLLLPALMLRIEDQLRQGQTNLEYLYEGLKVYLMLGDQDRFDPAAVKAWVQLDWQEQPRRFTTEQRADLDGHLDALLANYPDTLPIPLDAGLVARTRARVTQVPLAQRVYGRLKLSRTAREMPEVSVATAAGKDAALVFRRKSGEPLSRGVPGLYTLEGYRKVVERQVPLVAKDLLAESWVLGAAEVPLEPAKVQELVGSVQELYFADYIRQWDSLLKDLDLIAFANLRQAVDVTGVLSGKDSPLRRLLTTVARETTFEAPEADPAKAPAAGGDTLSAVKDKLSQMFQSAPLAAAATAPARGRHPVDAHFADLHALVRDGGTGGAPIDSVLAGFEELHVHINSIASAMDRGGTALDAAQQGSVGGAVGKLKLQAKRQPAPLGAWITDVADGSSSLTLGNARGHVNGIWTSQVLPFCQRALGNRYPIARGSNQDVTLADFSRLFAPGGLIDGFFQKYLSPFVDTSGKTWRWRSDGEATLGSSAESLRQFQRAAEIREAFFGAGTAPTVSFQLRPISMDSAIERFSLDLDGQPLAYSHGPVRPTTINWPGPAAGQVTMEVSPPAVGGRSAITLTGPWAVFRLFDRASIEPTAQPEEFRVTFEVGGRKAVYALTASSVVNPFRLPALHAFSCPERL
ncbi:MAG: type VI secretion system membrane subunit TssM [Gammaproteobacteria bacterium]|jgi:type VI secretion system protein ImpL|nr:type VI secretion system membrane subunit TssM [Gammaproteobacteria bacterium]